MAGFCSRGHSWELSIFIDQPNSTPAIEFFQHLEYWLILLRNQWVKRTGCNCRNHHHYHRQTAFQTGWTQTHLYIYCIHAHPINLRQCVLKWNTTSYAFRKNSPRSSAMRSSLPVTALHKFANYHSVDCIVKSNRVYSTDWTVLKYARTQTNKELFLGLDLNSFLYNNCLNKSMI